MTSHKYVIWIVFEVIAKLSKDNNLTKTIFVMIAIKFQILKFHYYYY